MLAKQTGMFSEPMESEGVRKVTFEFFPKTDYDLINAANLGRKKQKCRICGAAGEFQTWLGIEMFIGLQEEFRYFACDMCQVLQIEEFPENVAKYYATDYYSFREPPIYPVNTEARRDSRFILDVGCGGGNWLCYLASIGCVNLYGCDPFLEKDIEYPNGVKIKKCSIHEMDGKYDVIRLNHSFEHMPDPHEVFNQLDRLLGYEDNEFGEAPKIEIDIPIFPNVAFDIYGPYWYQMDAPRHFFLHSVKSIDMLAKANGFTISQFNYVGGGSSVCPQSAVSNGDDIPSV